MKKRFARNDVIFFAVVLALAAGICIWFYIAQPKHVESVTVTVDGEVYGVYPLAEEREIPILNAEGEISNVLLISNGEAKMIQADCPDKLCMLQRAISNDNETIVCLPNRVVVLAAAPESVDIDAIAK